jgi:hypothetical protein
MQQIADWLEKLGMSARWKSGITPHVGGTKQPEMEGIACQPK